MYMESLRYIQKLRFHKIQKGVALQHFPWGPLIIQRKLVHSQGRRGGGAEGADCPGPQDEPFS